jgi:hypothetical protein
MVNKEYKKPSGVYKVQTFRTTQKILIDEDGLRPYSGG